MAGRASECDNRRDGFQIDGSFDVAGVSELAHRERSAFKPVYSMNRWWARRSSAVFRAILLGLLDEGGDSSSDRLYLNAREAFPKADHQVILDPFMGGGTTVVEALRVGFRSVGVDLNPLSWFIVRNECTAVDIPALDAAYERVRDAVEGKVMALYATTCPCCSEQAEIIHSFWSKRAACSTCGEIVEMRRDRVIGRRRNYATISYKELTCGECATDFHAELNGVSVTYTTEPRILDRTEKLWATIQNSTCVCPNCAARVAAPEGAQVRTKRVEAFAVQCPGCEVCTTERGPLPHKVQCPECELRYLTTESNTGRGSFECSQGHATSISDVARSGKGPLGFRMYAIEGYCPSCAEVGDVYPANVGYRFFKTPDNDDLYRFEKVERRWKRERRSLPCPEAMISDYEKTNRLIVHNYRHWAELFNPRQLLALGWMLDAIRDEPNLLIREALTAAFLGTLEHQNMLNIYYLPYAQSAGAFGRHDFHPKTNACEGNPWGGAKGRGTFRLSYATVREGKQYLLNPFEPDYRSGKRERVMTGEKVTARQVNTFGQVGENGSGVLLKTGDSRHLKFLPTGSVDHVVTDPPYADAVQYSELADFFYVWLREALGDVHPDLFAALETPKDAELVENISRGHTQSDFHDGLTAVFKECHRVMKDSGRLVFTFHHSRRSEWEYLHKVILDAGFDLIASYPVASEGTRSGNLVFHTNRQSVAYDIIHVCKKRNTAVTPEPVRWSAAKRQINRRVRRAVKDILSNVDHGQRVESADVAVMVWSEVLRVYSNHVNQVVFGKGQLLGVTEALSEADTLVEEITVYATEMSGSNNLRTAAASR
jgi:hypothetical protein